MTVFAAAAYQEPIRSLIVAKRWSNIAASVQLGELIWEKTCFKYAHADILVPIPLHWSRQAWRGYNQAQEIAHALARKKGCSVISLLKRVRHTPFQSKLPATKRGENLAGAFALVSGIDPAAYRGKHIILVDDLMTTGSTLREAARVLRSLKPASITAVVAARAK
jgi:ComF family protein